tara:strand:+ start:361 stop:795 length:435 start_codon:yes stop_codon:yes gene_type:complete
MNFYLTLKALHLVAVISWMAGLLYLPRIFVYHSERSAEKNVSEVFKTMEFKLYNYIMMPAMILSWVFGLLLISSIGFDQLSNYWLILKLIFVTILTAYHFFLGICLNKFRTNENKFSSRFFRVFNEIPTLLLILIVFIVVFKPL